MRLCENGHGVLVGRAIQPAACFQQASSVANKSRPERGCRLIARPTSSANPLACPLHYRSGVFGFPSEPRQVMEGMLMFPGDRLLAI
jgi:hypothetical protein